MNADLLAAEKTAPEFRQLTHALVSVTENQTKIRRNLDLFFLVATPRVSFFKTDQQDLFFYDIMTSP
ncbi:MAG: hypothetical protein NWS07_02670 [Desulfobacterales bacterium]|nr:hypothetical protein [Desulfobacterales bacterium]